MHTRTFIARTAIACAVLAMAACSEDSPTAPSQSMAFQVRLAPAGTFQANGIMRFDIVEGEFRAYVQATGLDPGQRIPQHIHVNPTCNPGGGVLINLDQNLTVAGEGPGVGAAYPMADATGYLVYQARRPLADVMSAVNRFFPTANVQSVEGLIEFLDLENRNGHMHVAFGPPFPAVNCGEVVRVK